ncbi:MAG: glycosyltransferase family 1 protein [Chloroflexi bacterium HGW-Chloroflexi-6]|nr:MAG: glycosyltransferase family 1 protein [Chloroflexi bacterium HGW-Chloroflexi-6]
MKIGIAGPVSLRLLSTYVEYGEQMPAGYLFAPMAAWVESLLMRDHQISIFTLAPGISTPLTFTGKQLTIHIGRYRAHHRAHDFFKQEQEDLLKAIQKDPVDILHANWTYEFALAGLKSGLPTLITAHDAPLNILKIYPDPYRFARLLMARQVCQKAQIMTAVSRYIENHFRQVFRFKAPIFVIPNGVPDFIFNLAKPNKAHSQQKNTVFASNLTGWVGRKNGKTLILAFSLLRKQYPECILWMFGAGHGENEAAHIWAKKMGIAENIVFRGQTPYQQLLEEMAEHVDALVHPAIEESFSMAIAEAMAMGIPVIGGRESGAVPETIGQSGILVDIKNPHDLANAMAQLVQDRSLRNNLAKLGFEKAKNCYKLDKVTQQYENIYKLILSA